MGLFGKKIPVEIIIPSIAVGGFNRRVGQVKLLGGSKAARAQRGLHVAQQQLLHELQLVAGLLTRGAPLARHFLPTFR